MSFLGIIGVLLGILAVPFASRESTRTSFAVVSIACIAHVGATFVYYLYVQTAGGDSDLYYFDELRMHNEPFRLGTIFVVHFVQGLKGALGGTYLDYFLLFQGFGFWGIALLMRTFEELHHEFGERQDSVTYLLLFIPGLHFWTSAIGKDSLLFFGASLTTWAAVRLQRRQPAFMAGVVLMLMVRPHIAAVALLAVAVSLMFSRDTSRILRFLLVLAAGAGTVLVLGTMQSTYNIDVSNAESVSDFFARQEVISRSASGGNTAVTGSFPFRLFSLMLRPLFLDAEGVFGMATSLENIAFVAIYLRLLWGMRIVGSLFRSVAFARYVITFAGLLIVLLTLVYYNVGLGLRQRTMFIPAVLCLFVMVRLVGKARAAAAAPPVPGYAQ